MQNDEYQIMFEAEESHWWYGALHRMIAQGMPSSDLEGKLSVLDVGCGTGGFISRFCGSHFVIGLDYSPIALGHCKMRGLDNLFRGNIQSLPFADKSFDIVVCSSVLYHRWVDDIKAALRECHRVLKKSGLLILNVPSNDCPTSDHDRRVYTARRFSKKELKALLLNFQFGIKHFSSWTTLVFPMVWLIRRFKLLRNGRDFDSNRTPSSGVNSILKGVMCVECFIQRWFQLPFGVSIFCIAQKN